MGDFYNMSKALQSGVEKHNTAFLPVKIFFIRHNSPHNQLIISS